MYFNYYTLENISIISDSNYVVQFTGNHTGYLFFINCLFYTQTPDVKGLVFTNTTSVKIDMFRTIITIAGSGNSNAFYTTSGSAVVGGISNCMFYGRGAATISVDGSSNLSFSYSYMDNQGSDNIVEFMNTVTASFSCCSFANSRINSNGISLSSGTLLFLTHCTFSIPTNETYNPISPGSPPATTVGYVIKGSVGSSLVYGGCLFAPFFKIGSTYYWGTKAISNTINVVPHNTTLTEQA
jgi:hypothetical protein